MVKKKQLKMRPYARLLTMLGEQLIKNERIALIELIKNSYDADARWVKVTFSDFGSDYQITSKSKIIIEDNGHGMNQEIIENHWLNPATPEKKIRKKTQTTKKGRIIQGEKGIGRFATLKLGRKIDVISRMRGESQEHHLSQDFSQYDDEFLEENKHEKQLFIDDLRATLVNRTPECIFKSNVPFGFRVKKKLGYGTIIIISNLKGSWSKDKVTAVYQDLAKLYSIFAEKSNIDFEVKIHKDEEYQNLHEDYLEKLHILLNERSVIKIENGYFDHKRKEYRYTINGKKDKKSIFDPSITGLNVFKRKFGNAGVKLYKQEVECGSFGFDFYVFDLSAQAPPKYKLDIDDKKIIKGHRIYLYRDNMRVYPYGDVEDDWLRIDAYRGTISAGEFLSNDQVVGVVNISHKDNPNLRDKTNREGLIDKGNATEHFIVLLQTFLSYIRNQSYKRYRADIKNKKDQDIFATGQVQKRLDELRVAVDENKKAIAILSKAEREYKVERRYLTRRVEITEELAGVGLSVETASHDIMSIMGSVLINLDGLIHDLMSNDKINKEEMFAELQSIRGGMGFIEAQLKDIQLLFTSSKQRRKSIKIQDIVEKVERIYKRLLNKEGIKLDINSIGPLLAVKTTDAVLLQLLLNLFDNAIYWLQQSSIKNKKIEILLDGDRGVMTFSDNGPGIDKDNVPYIFEPFYSGKGIEGRGLGLYIARQLLERSEYSIYLATLKSEKILGGANFIIDFLPGEE